nr:SseB family protein [Candidatus Thiosymbion oneisti]
MERQLMAAQENRIPPASFLRTLLDSEVFMPVYEKHQIGGFATDTKARPLKVRTEGGEEVLVLFTNPERAKAFVKDYPGYGGGLVVEFTWILEKLGIGYGITLNPGLAFGIDFEAQDLARIAAMGSN